MYTMSGACQTSQLDAENLWPLKNLRDVAAGATFPLHKKLPCLYCPVAPNASTIFFSFLLDQETVSESSTYYTLGHKKGRITLQNYHSILIATKYEHKQKQQKHEDRWRNSEFCLLHVWLKGRRHGCGTKQAGWGQHWLSASAQ